jgi:hypothetical protein
MPTIDFTAAKSSAQHWRMRAEEMRTIRGGNPRFHG